MSETEEKQQPRFLRDWDPETSPQGFVFHRNCCVCGRLERFIADDGSHVLKIFDQDEGVYVDMVVCSDVCRDRLMQTVLGM